MGEDLNKVIETMLRNNANTLSYATQIYQINEKVKAINSPLTELSSTFKQLASIINHSYRYTSEIQKAMTYTSICNTPCIRAAFKNFETINQAFNKTFSNLAKINIDKRYHYALLQYSDILQSVNLSTETIRRATIINNLLRDRLKGISEEKEVKQQLISIEKKITDYHNEVRKLKTHAENLEDKNNIKANLEVAAHTTAITNNVVATIFYLIMIYYTLFPNAATEDELMENIQGLTEKVSAYEQQMADINKRLEQEPAIEGTEKNLQETSDISDTSENQAVQPSEKTGS